MKRSLDRVLTTHTGSLPRRHNPHDVRAEEAAGRRAALAASGTRNARGGRPADQRRITVVNDGELSKPSYATYIKDRLSGFDGTSQALQYRDLVDFPEMAKRVFNDPGRSRRKTPACTGPIGLRDPAAAQVDVDNLTTALRSVEVQDVFMSAASPGVISLFFRDDHYRNHEAYLFAIADAMRHEYETVARAGFILQLDCPDLGMGRHIQFADLGLEDFRRMAHLHLAALDHAVANIPPEQLRIHLCWGNYEGPHHYDVPLADILDLVLAARPQGVSFEAANPRHGHEWRVFERMKLPPGKLIIPGVIDSTTNFIEHPELVAERIGRFARLVGRENVVAGTDCGFGTWVGQAAVDPDIFWAKLATLRGARLLARALVAASLLDVPRHAIMAERPCSGS
jgi:5-methyltetrahydropteroyltriglutamate--homocysteine methyltransferase